MDWISWTILGLAFVVWHIALYIHHRSSVLDATEKAWTLGHKLGRVSGMMGPLRVSDMLDKYGIRLSDLPPLDK